VNEVPFCARPYRSVHNTLGVEVRMEINMLHILKCFQEIGDSFIAKRVGSCVLIWVQLLEEGRF
jgi:hypothetical protein